METSTLSIAAWFIAGIALLLTVWRLVVWRQRYGQLLHDYQRVEKQQHALRVELQQTQDNYHQGSQQFAALGAQKQALSERLDESRDRVGYLESRLQKAQQDMSDYERRLAELRVTHDEKQRAYSRLERSFQDQQRTMQTEFQNLANKILDEKHKHFQSSSEQSLENLLKPFREQISNFQQRVDHVHEESLKSRVHLSSEIKQVLDIGLQMSSEAQNLSLALKGDKKLTGMWGELQLEQTLSAAGLVKGEHYLSQAMFNTSEGEKRYPDFVLLLPENKHIVLDSKASLVAYEGAVNATTDEERERLLNVHVLAIQQHIDDLSKKRYDQLPNLGSPDFVFMFVPIEGAYIEALKHKPRLFEYGVKRNVMLVSHTALLPILRTVANVWMVARSNAEAHELGVRAAELHDQVALLAERLRRMGDSIGQLNDSYNKVVTATAGRQGLYGKIQRFKDLASRSTRELPELETQQHDVEFDVTRLEQVEVVSDVES